jgi:hypothetical protein
MPNPLTDELTDDAKAELAAMFAELRVRYVPLVRPKRASRLQFWERPGW